MIRSALASRSIPSRSLPLRRSESRDLLNHRSTSSSSTTPPTATATPKTHLEYMREANSKMKEYHSAREMLRRGKLPPHPSNAAIYTRPQDASNGTSTNALQAAVVATFLLAFLATPYLGKKIATDHEFRKTYIPSWMDFTVPQPEQPWTRDELHAQMVAVQRHLVERAAAGEFAPDRLEALAQHMSPEKQREQVWDKIHPGLEEGEDVVEEE